MRPLDTAYINGKVYTVDDNFSVATAFGVSEDRFAVVGTDEEVLARCTPDTKVVDLKGQVVIPGLTDAHLHLVETGVVQRRLKMAGKSRQECIDMVAEAAKKAEPGEWILGRNWINDEWKDDSSFPTKEELDAVAPNNPVYLVRGCGHMAWLNTKAFEVVGIPADIENPQGGEYLRKPDGSFWGVVTDNAQEPFNKAMPKETPEVVRQATLDAQKAFFEAGLVGVHDAGSGTHVVDVWDQMYDDGSLKLRINASLRVPGRPAFDELYEYTMNLVKLGVRHDCHNNRLNVRGYKISGDGSLGARSAWMIDDYDDLPGHKGNGKWTDEELYATLYPIHKAGFQIWYHGIGDAANRQALDCFKRLQEEFPRPDARHRIEHAQILKPEDVERFAKEGVIPTHQTVFLRTDKRCCEDRIGKERTKTAYAWHTLISQGNPVPNGTDSPVESFNPFLGMYCAVTRKDEDGFPEGGWYPDEAMTREEALKSYTVWPAYTEFMEGVKGSIANGQLADFVIIDRDYMTCPDYEIKDIKPVATYVAGECVYEA